MLCRWWQEIPAHIHELLTKLFRFNRLEVALIAANWSINHFTIVHNSNAAQWVLFILVGFFQLILFQELDLVIRLVVFRNRRLRIFIVELHYSIWFWVSNCLKNIIFVYFPNDSNLVSVRLSRLIVGRGDRNRKISLFSCWLRFQYILNDHHFS